MKRLKGFGTRRVLLFLSFFLFSLPEEKKRRLFPSSSLISQHFERVSNREVINYDIAFILSCFLLRSIATWLLFFCFSFSWVKNCRVPRRVDSFLFSLSLFNRSVRIDIRRIRLNHATHVGIFDGERWRFDSFSFAGTRLNSIRGF